MFIGIADVCFCTNEDMVQRWSNKLMSTCITAKIKIVAQFVKKNKNVLQLNLLNLTRCPSWSSHSYWWPLLLSQVSLVKCLNCVGSDLCTLPRFVQKSSPIVVWLADGIAFMDKIIYPVWPLGSCYKQIQYSPVNSKKICQKFVRIIQAYFTLRFCQW